MKKRLLVFVFLSLLISLPLQLVGQDNVNINVGENGLKSVSKARSIALSNTALAIGTGVATVAIFNNNTIETTGALLGVYGIWMGPSTGNFYANDYPRGMIGMAARVAGSFLMIDATKEIFGNQFANTLKVDDRKVSFSDTKTLIGGALILAGTAYNILSLRASVDEYNQSMGQFGMNMNSVQINGNIAPVLTARINL